MTLGRCLVVPGPHFVHTVLCQLVNIHDRLADTSVLFVTLEFDVLDM